jgi:hypothetical protein
MLTPNTGDSELSSVTLGRLPGEDDDSLGMGMASFSFDTPPRDSVSLSSESANESPVVQIGTYEDPIVLSDTDEQSQSAAEVDENSSEDHGSSYTTPPSSSSSSTTRAEPDEPYVDPDQHTPVPPSPIELRSRPLFTPTK